ncbi:hypothetical protein GC425_05475 [Corynebacterium sp. zg254]|uniref:MinD-like ATPase involved in chromosome partitioning or flagellar assembly n=1 Tax=Corynebacterium zhongnanshanii TaxID=2768834 RepID=A0ABQ6VE28_9CORY|nr:MULTISPECIES: hypothetical protein [Corynebacterium]KAB3522640.1 hypothetical protein F8377_00130 [Corynebacterium zhongnanshanii]MCR5914315.1 hypothetical protein [Corynebacterium sp. zg254]
MARHAATPQVQERGPRAAEIRTTNTRAADARPVIVDVQDAQWLEEAQMIAAATGRTLLSAATPQAVDRIHAALEGLDDVRSSGARRRAGGAAAIVIHDRPNPLQHHPRIRAIDVAPDSTQVPRPLSQGGALDLARLVGMHDLPLIAVYGAVGGAGTTVFSVCLAHALSGDYPSVVLDASPQSLGVDIALGKEHSVSELGVRTLLECNYIQLLSRAPRIGKIPIIGQAGTQWQQPALLDSAACVADCGTLRPGSDDFLTIFGEPGGNSSDDLSGMVPDAHVVVTIATVPGLMYAKRLCDRLADQWGVDPLVVVRDFAGSDVPHSLMPVILQRYRMRTVRSDAAVARALNKGEPEHFLHDGHSLVRSADSLVQEWKKDHTLLVKELLGADVPRGDDALRGDDAARATDEGGAA